MSENSDLDIERKKRLPNFKFLLDLGIKSGDKVIDFGAGVGYFTVPLAKIVGNKGQVYAVDNSKKMVEKLKSAASQFSNLKVIHSKGANLAEVVSEKVDYILLSHTFHELKEKEEVLSILHNLLKTGGKIAFIEFDVITSVSGTVRSHRFSKDDLLDYLIIEGFRDFSEIPLLGSEYCLVAQA